MKECPRGILTRREGIVWPLNEESTREMILADFSVPAFAIAQELVLNYPQKVEKLVLCSTSCGGKESVPPSEDVRRTLMADRSAGARASITEDFVRKNPDWAELMMKQVLKAPISD